ncbi:50S ribosomal protein L10, chloroplastic-like [Lolium rigidum]|uniref:50S ribosomal protein L10, chloroplastic-like n=1 Tax=Lolium rigidum TaxID=89674 RepID=UPI001F5C6087|nr:50S ribosomal protein L10, chloroplastic-like [Lolium rigidum]
MESTSHGGIGVRKVQLASGGRRSTRARQEVLRRELDGCQLLAGIWCHGFTVAQLRSIRASLPPTARLVVAKNSDLAAAVEGTRWASLRPVARGMNAWLFVRSDEIPPALRPYRDFQKDCKLQLNDFTGAVYEGRLYGPDDFTKLEAMPTRVQSYQYLLGCLQMPAVSLIAALRARQEAMANPPADDATSEPPEK